MRRTSCLRVLVYLLIFATLFAVGCESTPNSKSSSKVVTPGQAVPIKAKPEKKHVPHATDLGAVLHNDLTIKEFNEYRAKWRDWPEDTGKFKTTTKYRLPGGEFLIWWKPDKYTPEAKMAAYRVNKYRE